MNFRKANVIIVTLFITLITGIIGLIVTKYILGIVNISSENYKYYKAYYAAYAGVELDLLKMNLHQVGFEDKINSSSPTVIRNFSDVSFSSSLRSLSKYISGTPKSLIFTGIDYCADEKNWIFLKTGDAVLIPLVYDKNTGEGKLSGSNLKLLIPDLSNTYFYYNGQGVFSFQSTDNAIKQSFGGNGNKRRLSSLLDVAGISTNVDKKPFFVIASTENTKVCLKSDDSKIVAPYSVILSQGEFRKRTVILNVAKTNKWANFSVYGIY